MKDKIEFDLTFSDKVIGVDEAGRGPLAGPVVATAVFIEDYNGLEDIDDSKKLSAKKRAILYEKILKNAKVGISFVSSKEIDKINILQATIKAMNEAIKQVFKEGFFVLVDGNTKVSNYPQKTVVKGDSKSLSIAAASIVAKVTRDNFMLELSNKYPQYYFEKHKGYGTKVHIDAIKKFGIIEEHRITFLRNILKS